MSEEPEVGNEEEVAEEAFELSGEFQEGDIIFECPSCSKSLAIDPRGAGLMISCPDCQSRIQVPFPDEDEEALEEDILSGGSLSDLEDALGASQQKVRDQMLALEALTKRRDTLEKLRDEYRESFKVVRQEMSILQGAIDRIVATLEDVAD